MQRITYIISDIDKALAFEWIALHLDRERFQLSFILLNPGPSQLETFLTDHGFDARRVVCRGKKDWLSAILNTYRHLQQLRPAGVHCHLIQANIIGLAAAKLAGIKQRIYTRHHSSLHHIYHPKGVWWDKLSNRLATKIVAISGVVEQILLDWEHADPKKVLVIPHGFDLSLFDTADQGRIEGFRSRIQLNGQTPVVGVISRFTEWKGVQYIIPAFARVLEQYPKAVLLLLNARGDYEPQILELLQAIPRSAYRLIPFEKDVAAAYQVMDAFVHVPIDEHSEAFGQIYVEALATGVPSVFTRSGIANESYFTPDAADFVAFKDSGQVADALFKILGNKDGLERRRTAGKAVAARFQLSTFIQQLENLYAAPR